MNYEHKVGQIVNIKQALRSLNLMLKDSSVDNLTSFNGEYLFSQGVNTMIQYAQFV